MEIRDIRPSEIEAARRLLEASGWTCRVSDPADFRELLSRSQRAIVAVEGGEVIGFLCALTDGMANGYISIWSSRRITDVRALVARWSTQLWVMVAE
jgi:hypothetical protein